jgi:hypothetical protein
MTPKYIITSYPQSLSYSEHVGHGQVHENKNDMPVNIKSLYAKLRLRSHTSL